MSFPQMKNLGISLDLRRTPARIVPIGVSLKDKGYHFIEIEQDTLLWM